jgi:hypothetical protein
LNIVDNPITAIFVSKQREHCFSTATLRQRIVPCRPAALQLDANANVALTTDCASYVVSNGSAALCGPWKFVLDDSFTTELSVGVHCLIFATFTVVRWSWADDTLTTNLHFTAKTININLKCMVGCFDCPFFLPRVSVFLAASGFSTRFVPDDILAAHLVRRVKLGPIATVLQLATIRGKRRWDKIDIWLRNLEASWSRISSIHENVSIFPYGIAYKIYILRFWDCNHGLTNQGRAAQDYHNRHSHDDKLHKFNHHQISPFSHFETTKQGNINSSCFFFSYPSDAFTENVSSSSRKFFDLITLLYSTRSQVCQQNQ